MIAVLQKGLKSNFDEVEVNVVTSPDLTEEPFNLASEGNQMHKKAYQESIIEPRKLARDMPPHQDPQEFQSQFARIVQGKHLQDCVEIPKFWISEEYPT